jgi:hypothetical protein
MIAIGMRMAGVNKSGQDQKMERLKSDTIIDEENPPILGSWKKIYLVVLLTLAALIILFYFFSEAYK